MKVINTMKTNNAPDGLHAEQQALLAVLGQMLSSMAKLCLSKGISIQAVEEALRQAFVDMARQSCEGVNPDRMTSRISTMTGLTRREVGRLQASEAPGRPSTRSVATDVLTHWAAKEEYVNKKGLPIPITRMGPAPSFEALAAHVTKDVHPKSVLNEMLRLGLVTHHAENDMVRVVDAIYVPQKNWVEMVSFLGANVGDHLQAAVENVLGDGRQHLEQSLLADELSAQSLQEAKVLITRQWHELMTQLGPQLQSLMDRDKAEGLTQDQQIRIGMYSYMSKMIAEEEQR